MKISKIDEYGIKEYATWIKLFIPIIILYVYIQIAGHYLYIIEHEIGNIKTYEDAKWVVQMAASTIGFGDFYPVTETERDLVAMSFYTGLGILGFIASTVGDMLSGFTDKSIQNRELRRQNAEILAILKHKEQS